MFWTWLPMFLLRVSSVSNVKKCKSNVFLDIFLIWKWYSRDEFRGEREGRTPSLLFAITCFFAITLKNNKLIINNAAVPYVYPNTIETYVTPNHLSFGRQLLHYSNTASTLARNLTVFSSTTDKINHISNHFWDRWRYKYAVNLRRTQRTSKLNINSPKYMLR